MKLCGYISFQDRTLNLEGISFNLLEGNQNIDTGQRRPVFFILEKDSKIDILISDIDGKLKYGNPDVSVNQEEFKRKLFELDLALGFWYNSDTNELVLARDIFGFTPLYYIFKPGKFFAFATTLPLLASIREIREFLCPNTQHIINYLHAWGFNYPTNSESIFQGVHSVLPGHCLSVSSSRTLQEIYLNFGAKKFNLNSSSLSDYGELFGELFAKSLQHLTSGYSRIGMHLSGGIDSSSITCMMNWLFPEKEYNTFYLDPLSVKNQDVFYVNEVLKTINATHTIVKPEGDFRKIFYDSIVNNGQPSIMVSGPIIGSLLRSSAMERSCEILLSGNGGDEIVGHGLDYPLSKFNNHEWEELYRLMAKRSGYGEHPEFRGDWSKLSDERKGLFYFNNYVFRHAFQTRDINKIISILINFGNLETWKYFITIVSKILHKKIFSERGQNLTLARSELLSLNNFNDNIVLTDESPKSTDGMLGIYSWKGIRLNEELINMDTNSIKQFYPFYNRDLYELSLEVPSEMKYNSGLTRGHLRYAMKGIIPHSLQIRAGKFSFSNYSNFVAKTLYSQSRDYLTDGAEIWTFVNKKVFERSLKELNSNKFLYKSSVHTINVLRTISLAFWLDWYRKL